MKIWYKTRALKYKDQQNSDKIYKNLYCTIEQIVPILQYVKNQIMGLIELIIYK